MGNVEVVRELLNAGAKVDVATDEYDTPLHRAINRGHSDAAYALLAAGAAYPSDCDCWWWDKEELEDPAKAAERAGLIIELGTKKLLPALLVLSAGISWDFVEAVKLSIDEGLDALNALLKDDSDGFWDSVCLDVAVVLFPRLDREEFVWGMIEHCGNLGAGARDLLRELVGFPTIDELVIAGELMVSVALFGACGTGDLELVKVLLSEQHVHLGKFGWCPWGWDKSTTTHAAACGQNEILRFILDNPPKTFSKIDADLGLVACAMADDVEYATRLLAAGATPRYNIKEIGQGDYHQSSALRVACSRANVTMVKLLLANGAKVNKVWPRSEKLDVNPARPFWKDCELVCALQSEPPQGTGQSCREYVWPPLPPPSADEEARRVEIVRLLVAEGAIAADARVEKDPLYLRAFPAAGAGAEKEKTN